MDFKKGLRNLIYVDETPKASEKTTEKVTEPLPQVPLENIPSPKIRTTVLSVDQKVCDALRSTINDTGSSFSQFLDMLSSLTEVISDEATRYAAAMKAVSKMGVTQDQIIRALDTKLGVLEEEKGRFEISISKKTESIKDINPKVMEKLKQIDLLQKEVEDLKLSEKEENDKILTSRTSFMGAYNTVKGEIERQKEIIEKYIGGK